MAEIRAEFVGGPCAHTTKITVPEGGLRQEVYLPLPAPVPGVRTHAVYRLHKVDEEDGAIYTHSGPVVI